jgi:hypothetical protein
MIGDPYMLLTPTTQSSTFDITDIGIITEIKAWFYHNNNFAFWNGSETQLLGNDEINLNIKNLFVNDIEIGLGIGNLDKIPDNTLQLYTSGALEYGGPEETGKDNSRDISLIWYNKSGANSYIGFSDGIYDPYYDEIEYLTKLEKHNDLKAQTVKDVPNDEIGLQVSKTTSDILNNMETILTEYFDKNGYFYDLFNAFEKHPDMDIFFKEKENVELFNYFDILRSEAYEPLSKIKEKAENYYTNLLKQAKQLQNTNKFDQNIVDSYKNNSEYYKLYEDLQLYLEQFVKFKYIIDSKEKGKIKFEGLDSNNTETNYDKEKQYVIITKDDGSYILKENNKGYFVSVDNASDPQIITIDLLEQLNNKVNKTAYNTIAVEFNLSLKEYGNKILLLSELIKELYNTQYEDKEFINSNTELSHTFINSVVFVALL